MTVQTFDILSRETPIYCNRLIEASAGTGKTFTMEHLIVRLLLESPRAGQEPCLLQEILTVTFTRAAVADMQRRLHSNLQKTLKFLNQTLTESVPDYIKAILEQGQRTQLEAARRIELALHTFEEASLYTLHGFCAHALSKHPQYALQHFKEDPPAEAIHKTVHHFFRTQLEETRCHQVQLQKVLGLFRGSSLELEKALIRTLSLSTQIAPTFCFSDSFERFEKAMQELQAHGPFEKEKVLSDWHLLLPRYKQLNGKAAAEYTESVEWFTDLLAKPHFSLKDWGDLLSLGLPLAACEENKRLKALPEGSLFYPELPFLLKKNLLPLLEETLQPERIFAWMAFECQNLWKRYVQLEGGGGPDRLIEQTKEALSHPDFVKELRKQYKVVLVDEFQDTDPLQWELLERLFLHHSPLVLVGDPKQSIYSFRSADLYTYYTAASHFKASTSSLTMNYRSDGPLVKALNSIFCHETSPSLFDLPKTGSFIPYPIVQAARPELSLKEGAAIQFLLHKGVKGRKKNWPTEEIEKEVFLPECVREMIKLHTKSQISFSEMAVLVRDRHQAADVYTLLEEVGIPACIHRRSSLLDSEAWDTWIEWLEAMLFPEEASLTSKALVGLFLRCPPQSVIAKDQAMQERLYYMALLRDLLETKGLSAHSEVLFFTPYKKGEASVFAYLMQTPTLKKTAQELQHILELLLEYEAKTACSLYGLFDFLCRTKKRLLYDEEKYQSRLASQEEAVCIVTMHKSKGLEFDIVFSLGTAKRGVHREILIQDQEAKPALLHPYREEDPLYHANCLEQDAEKLRHAYVAMTRAKKRLYLTYAIATDGSKLELGEASPLDLLFARLDQPKASLEELYPRINTWNGEGLCNWIHQHPELSISYRFLEAAETLPSFSLSTAGLSAPAKVAFSIKPFYTLSYSACVNKKEEFSSATPPSISSHHVEEKRVQLPEGRETGIFLHHLLALLSWQKLSSASGEEEVLSLIHPFIQGSSWESYGQTLSQLLYQTWHTPLALLPGEETFCLADVNPLLQSREMEFLYQDERLFGQLDWTGSIDLFFAHKGFYYLIDWKSHDFSKERESEKKNIYTQKVEEEGLLLQAAIYSKALKRYLKKVEPRPFSECFGGFAFLFLREIHPQNVGQGVAFYSHETLERISIPLPVDAPPTYLWKPSDSFL